MFSTDLTSIQIIGVMFDKYGS